MTENDFDFCSSRTSNRARSQRINIRWLFLIGILIVPFVYDAFILIVIRDYGKIFDDWIPVDLLTSLALSFFLVIVVVCIWYLPLPAVIRFVISVIYVPILMSLLLMLELYISCNILALAFK